MSECSACGTGGGVNIPQPGDPDNNIALSARTVYGGINVSWTWPTVNEAAVAQTIVYRGLSNNPIAMIEIARVGGSLYFDALNAAQDTTYYYWIQIVSVNGTRLDKIGPVSAVAKNRGQMSAEDLTGLIDSSVLAQALKDDIAGINQIGSDLLNEIQDRIAANAELSGLLSDVQNGLVDAITYLNTEIINRKDGDSAIVSELVTMAAAVQDNAALIFEERTVRASADEALAQEIVTLYARTDDNEAALQQEISARTTADSAQASQLTTLTGRVDTAQATIISNNTASVNRDSALGSQINGVETSLNGNISTVRSQLQSQITTTDGKVTAIGALWTAQVQVNGLIGGFGVYNNGQRVDAGFDVDLFWIGRTQANKVKPFIVSGDTVYIDNARIRSADITTLKIAGNAVTVPAFTTAYGTTYGNGSYTEVGAVSISLDQAGMVFASTTGLIAYGQGWESVDTYLTINGVRVSSGGGEEGYVAAVHSGGQYCPAGQVIARLYFRGSSNKARIIDPTIFIMGAKR